MLKFGGSSYLSWDLDIIQHYLGRNVVAKLISISRYTNVLIQYNTFTSSFRAEVFSVTTTRARVRTMKGKQCALWRNRKSILHSVHLRRSSSYYSNTHPYSNCSKCKTNWTLSSVHRHSDKHAPGKIPRAQCAFKVLMIHEVLQFASRIAFRCVLHRCGNLDIHRWKL